MFACAQYVYVFECVLAFVCTCVVNVHIACDMHMQP